MSDKTPQSPYRIYWVTWLILLVITIAMLAAEKFHMPRWFLVVFLLAFMTVKAAMIGGNFMHLRYEHRRIPIMVACGIVVTSLSCFWRSSLPRPGTCAPDDGAAPAGAPPSRSQ
jgi:caa(3)-type oxidase subunit IV